MKTDFSVNVQVNIGVTPEVVQLVTALLTKKEPAAIAAPESEQPTDQAPAQTKRARKVKTADAPAEESVQAAEAEAPADNDDAAPEEPTPAPESSERKELTEQDVRDAMRKTRQRIEGEDYDNNTNSEGYKKYHKKLTAMFKTIAAELGSDKPSTLPADKRESFIKQCDELVAEGDAITTKLPY